MSASNDAAGLRRGFILSALFHALIFLFLSDFLALTATNAPEPKGDQAMLITLQQRAAAAASPAAEPQVLPNVATPKPDMRSRNSNIPLPEKFKLETNTLEPSAPGAESVESTEATNSKGASEVRDVSPPIRAEALNVDDVRQYRMNLSREARRYKRYPLFARERGLEGTAVVVVSTRVGLVIPQVSLSASSGTPSLDAQALEMIRLAVRDAKIPESLRNRDFGIDLPIQFALDD